MAIASRMEAQIRGTNQAIRNAADGQALIDTAEGAHAEVEFILQRMRELAVQSANDTNTSTDRLSLNAEVNQLISEIDRIAAQTTWGGNKLLDGTFLNKTLQIGAYAAETTSVSIDSIATANLGAYEVNSRAVAMAAGADAGSTTNTLTTTTLTVTGPKNSAAVTVAAEASAKTVAAAVNAATPTTAVSAAARTNLIIDAIASTGTVAFTLGGSSTAAISVSVVDTADLRGLRDAINEKAGATGVTATLGTANSKLILTSSTGENISIVDFTHDGATKTMSVKAADFDGVATSAAAVSLSGATSSTTDSTLVVGQVKFTSVGAFNVLDSGGHATNLTGYFASATAVSASPNNLQTASVSTVANATSAIRTIDGALLKIADQRGNLGAVSNRLDSTMRNLTNVVTNIQAAQGRIQDADFAAETTNLAKSQILQQASMAMLAQANASKQGVLSLLQGR